MIQGCEAQTDLHKQGGCEPFAKTPPLQPLQALFWCSAYHLRAHLAT